MTNQLYEGIDKQLAAKDAEIAALRELVRACRDWYGLDGDGISEPLIGRIIATVGPSAQVEITPSEDPGRDLVRDMTLDELFKALPRGYALRARDEVAALRTALALAWEWIDDPELEGTLIVSSIHGNTGSDRMRNLIAAARHAKDVANALLTSRV